MNKSILMVVEAVSLEKRVEKEVIFEALEAALAAATKKKYTEETDIHVTVDRETGEYTTFRRWHVVDNIELPDQQISLAEAEQKKSNAKMDDIIEELVESVTFGRIESQMAKQVIMQRVRDAERARIVDEYKDRMGEIISGVVRKVTRDNVVIEIAPNIEALLKREHMLSREAFRVGERIRALLVKVSPEKIGIQLFLSRTDPEFLVKLFRIEVPEIEEGLIEIKGAARDPGVRAKIAVKANDPRLDPVGACVGMRGSRVQAVSNELDGERVDIVLWDENPAQFVINSMSPAEVKSIVMDEETNTMDIAVPEEQLSQAIGRNGQNVRLASQVTGWNLNVMSEKEATDKQDAETNKFRSVFKEQLHVDESVAEVLVQAGFTTVEEIAYVPLEDLKNISEFDEAMVGELRGRAKNYLLTSAIAKQAAQQAPAEDLLTLDGMNEELAKQLAQSGIVTREDLAEQSVADLQEVSDMSDEQAAELIMAARASWFTENEA